MTYARYSMIALALVIIATGAVTMTAQAQEVDLTVVGISTTDGSSIRLGIEPGQQSQISFTNVTWYIYSSGAVTESVDGNVTATHQVDGLLVHQARYEAGRHVITFGGNGTTQQFVLMISESASSIDWEELTGGKEVTVPQQHSEFYIWAVSILFFLAPMPLVYRRVRRLKRSEVYRIV